MCGQVPSPSECSISVGPSSVLFGRYSHANAMARKKQSSPRKRTRACDGTVPSREQQSGRTPKRKRTAVNRRKPTFEALVKCESDGICFCRKELDCGLISSGACDFVDCVCAIASSWASDKGDPQTGQIVFEFKSTPDGDVLVNVRDTDTGNDSPYSAPLFCCLITPK